MSIPVTALTFTNDDDAKTCRSYLFIAIPGAWADLWHVKINGKKLIISYSTDEPDVFHAVHSHAHGFYAACEWFRRGNKSARSRALWSFDKLGNE